MLENKWARQYINCLFETTGKNTEDLSEMVAASDIENIDDPLLEIQFLRQGASVIRGFNLVIAMLALCSEDAPLAMIADLVEAAEECNSKLVDARYALPALKTAVQDDPGNGDKLAQLGFCLNDLDESEEALSAFTNALEHPDTLCFDCHRDCLNNIGWHHYLRGEYEQALGWFGHACTLQEQIETGDDVILDDEDYSQLVVPYRLALENILLTLAKMGRLTEATARLEEYHKYFGRLPKYESSALEKLGLLPDAIFIRSRIEQNTEEKTP